MSEYAAPELRAISSSELEKLSEIPHPKIKTDHDLETWKTSQSYRDYSIFLRRLNESVVGYFLPWQPSETSSVSIALLTWLPNV
jgi:serine/threonine-protein phosphatase 2A activator